MISSDPEMNARVLAARFISPEMIRAMAKTMLLALISQQFGNEDQKMIRPNLTATEAITLVGGNKRKAAKAAGISRSSLYRRLQKEAKQ